MAVLSSTTGPTNSVQALRQADYLHAVTSTEVWTQFVWWKQVLNAERGNTVRFPVYSELDPRTATLAETDDVTPVSMSDYEVSIPVNEYANGIQRTAYLKATAYTDIDRAIATAMGQNKAKSMDFVVRNELMSGSTQVVRPNGLAARTDLDATNDLISYAFILQLVATARNFMIPAYDSEDYVTIVPPHAIVDITQLTTWLNVKQYQDKMDIYNGEIGSMFGGLRFVVHPYAKLYLSEGTVAQTATTINGAIAAGATEVVVADATGIVAGNHITLNMGSSATDRNTEQVRVTAVSSNTLTITGLGNTFGNFGTRFAHAHGESVAEGANVYALPIIGPRTLAGVYSSLTGEKGKITTRAANSFVPDRFQNVAWWFLGGFELLEKFSLRGEVATSLNVPAYNG